MYMHLRNVDIENYGDHMTSTFSLSGRREGVSKKSTV